MKLAYVELSGFRGYRKPLRIDFAGGFTIIDGRNGVGKSTIFDAIEFALTGEIAKYGDAKSDGETVADYIWWSNDGQRPADYYVEVGFQEEDKLFPVRRTQLSGVDPRALADVLELLCDKATMPGSPIRQLLATSIIRDELIAALSLDLKEADRYALLRDAIGASDADAWIDRGSKFVGFMKRRLQIAVQELSTAEGVLSGATRRIDEIRNAITEEAMLAAAAERLRTFAESAAPPDQLIGPARGVLAAKVGQIEQLAMLQKAWANSSAARERLPELRSATDAAREMKAKADANLAAAHAELGPDEPSNGVAQQAKDVALLVELGRKIGLRDDHCPLCAQSITKEDFAKSLERAISYANDLNAQAVLYDRRKRTHKEAEDRVVMAVSQVKKAEAALVDTEAVANEYARQLVAAKLPNNLEVTGLQERLQVLQNEVDAAQNDIRIVETLKFNLELRNAHEGEGEAKKAYVRAQDKLGLTRRAEAYAQALHDAARRAAGETLNRRLERVLPLMAELYQRMRPHPMWVDIDYKIRGDVRRFLKLQVGDDLNPQFMFSSGQRRATGLAFLLSINLSLAWSRWHTILLDDPVQHIDDFRSIHLAEVLAQLASDGRQVICAVEDSALAELLCRRLSVTPSRQGKRVTLGTDADGALGKLQEEVLLGGHPK